MQWLFLIVGIGAMFDGGFTLIFPGYIKKLSTRYSDNEDNFFAKQSTKTLRLMATVEFIFGLWMLLLYLYGRK